MSKYTGSLSVPRVGLRKYIKKKDKNKYVGQWQQFLNWYVGKEVCVVDNIYGDTTFKYTVKFQTEVFSKKEADGKVGAKTIEKAKAYNKVEKGKYPGPFPSVHVHKTAKEAINDGLNWGKIISSDNTFHYGEGGNKAKDFGSDVYNITHSAGCHFCDTNKRKKVNKIKKLKRSDLIATNWEKTYVCNSFVSAILAHGFLEPTILGYCSNGSCIGFDSQGKASRLDSNKNFTNKKKLSLSKLEPGDILVSPTHMQMVYSVNSGKIKCVESTSYLGKYGGSNSNKSTRIIEKKPYYTFVYRFTGTIDADIVMRYGEYGTRVGDWQDFLNWWSDGKFYKECGGRDNFFGNNTKKWTIKFQEKEIGIGSGDGLVGKKTIAKAKKVEK